VPLDLKALGRADVNQSRILLRSPEGEDERGQGKGEREREGIVEAEWAEDFVRRSVEFLFAPGR
jgi:hypothetical protein